MEQGPSLWGDEGSELVAGGPALLSAAVIGSHECRQK